MASEVELERLVVRLVGDSATYRRMLKEAETQAATAAKTIEKAGKKIEAVKSRLESFAGSMRNVGQSLTRVGRSLSLFVTAPLVAAGAAAIKAGSDFQSGFAGVRKTVNATEAEFATLRQGFKDMAATTPIAVTDLLRIGELGGQLGIATDSLLPFTKTIAELGVTTNLSVEEAAESFARFANITKMPQSQISNMGSTVVALGNTMATTERDIVSMGMRLAGAGTTVGMTVPQILAMAASLSSVGLEAEAGGTAFSKLFLMLQTSIATGDESLKEFARISESTVDDFSALFRKDAAGAVMSLLKGLGKLGADEKVLALQTLGLDESVRMTDAILRSSNAVEILDNAMQTAQTSFEENKALTKEAAERFKTFASAMTILWNNVKLLGEEIFTALEPTLRDLVKTIKDVTNWFRALSPEMKLQIVKVAALAAVLGPLLVTLGILVSSGGSVVAAVSAVAGAFQTYTTAAGAAKLATLGFNIALGAVAVGGILLLSKALYDIDQNVRDFNDAINESIKNLDKLRSRQARGTSDILFEAQQQAGPVSRKSFLAEALRQAKQEAAGYAEGVRGAKQNVAELDNWWSRFVGNKVLEAANNELKDQQSLLDGAKERVELLTKEYQKLGGTVLKDQSPSQAKRDFFAGKQVGPTSAADKKLLEDAAGLTQKLQEQAATLGMASEEAQIYALQLKGVAREELEAARASVRTIRAFEAEKRAFERAFDIRKDIMTPQEKFAEAQKELDNLFLDNKLSAEEYQKAMEKVKKETEDASKSAETAAGRFDAAAVGSNEAISRMLEFAAGKGRATGEAAKFALPERPDLAPALAEFAAMNRQAPVRDIISGGIGNTFGGFGAFDIGGSFGGTQFGMDAFGEFQRSASGGGAEGKSDTAITLGEIAAGISRLVELTEAEVAKPGLEDVEAANL